MALSSLLQCLLGYILSMLAPKRYMPCCQFCTEIGLVSSSAYGINSYNSCRIRHASFVGNICIFQLFRVAVDLLLLFVQRYVGVNACYFRSSFSDNFILGLLILSNFFFLKFILTLTSFLKSQYCFLFLFFLVLKGLKLTHSFTHVPYQLNYHLGQLQYLLIGRKF